MWITRYENETGRILGSEYHSSADGAEEMDTCALHGYYDPELFYYDSLAKKVLERPTMHIEISENTLTGLPLPCTVNVRRDNQTYRVEDGQFTYETPLPGGYEATVRSFPYIDWKGVLKVEG